MTFRRLQLAAVALLGLGIASAAEVGGPAISVQPPPYVDPTFDVAARTTARASDGVVDTTSIQATITAACAAGGGTVHLGDGNWDIDAPLTATCSNLHLVGNGIGRTVIRMAASMTASSSSAISFYNSAVGTSRALTLDAHIGDMAVNLAPADAASFSAGDWVLLRSKRAAEASSTITGTVDWTNGSAALVGHSTTFTTSLAVGQSIRPVDTNDWYTVSIITDNTHVTLASNFGGATIAGSSTEKGSTSKFIGELHRVIAADGTVGVLDLEGSLGETYYAYDAASVLKVTVLENVSLSDLSITHLAASAPSINVGTVVMRFVRNPLIERVYIHDVFHTAIDMWSTVGGSIDHVRVEDVRSASSQTVYYGVWVASATRGLKITSSDFSRMRHGTTTGTHSNSGSLTLSTDGREGKQQQVDVEGNYCYATTTACFDSHQPAEGVSFRGNHCFGAWPQGAPDTTVWNSATYCIQARADKTVIDANTAEFGSGGFFVFATEAKDAVVTNNIARDVVAPHFTSQLAVATSGGEGTITLRDARGFDATGSVDIGGAAVSYTGQTTTTLTGCSGVPAAALGAPVAQYKSGGHGIVFDSAAIGPGMTVSGNLVVNADGSCIVGNGNQNRLKITNNRCRATSLRSPTGTSTHYVPINIAGGANSNIDVSWNTIEDVTQNVAPIQITGTGDNHRIKDNFFINLVRYNPAWVGGSTLMFGNKGYHPGNVSSPWPATPAQWQGAYAGGTTYALDDTVVSSGVVYISLQNSNTGNTPPNATWWAVVPRQLVANISGGQANPDSTVTYTIGSGPAEVWVKNDGTVSSIAINGSVSGFTSGYFTLYPEDTFKVTHSVAPTTRIYFQ